MTNLDHFYLVLLLVVPIYGWHSYRQFLALARQGKAPAKHVLYLRTQVFEWLLFAGVALVWLVEGRGIDALGFVAPCGTGFWVSALVTALATAYLVFAWWSASRMDQGTREAQYRALGDLQYFLPDTPRALRHFAALSVTAGIVEEIVYRGFLLWYLVAYMPTAGAVVISAAIFALGHSYQGLANMLRVFVVGIAIGTLFVASGSIWIPIVLHILLDVLQGATLLEISRKTDGPATEPAELRGQ